MCVSFACFCFFFFKQKTAYEMRISDWSSDVCSSDLRKRSTEYPLTSPLNKEHRTGIFACAGCGQRLFSSKTKFDSGTGWPSFWAPLPRAVGTSRDFELGYPRTEVHCARSEEHTSELQSLMRISYAVFCLKKKKLIHKQKKIVPLRKIKQNINTKLLNT